MTHRSRIWLDTARADLASAEALIGVGRAASAFHYQQAAEKALKALHLRVGEPFDGTHNVAALWDRMAAKGAVEEITPEDRNAMKRLTAMYVEARIPFHDDTLTPEDWIDDIDLQKARHTAMRIVERIARILETNHD